MKGEIYEGRVFYYQPKRIVERGSTKAEATDDELVLRTLELIKLNVARPFGIEELAQKLDVSRRTLETRFRSRLGRTVLNVVHEIRMERACALLLETNYSIAEIAKKCGFRDGNYLATVFRQRFDVSPSQFRKIKRKRPF
jgi:LacI family transcriptional regulator